MTTDTERLSLALADRYLLERELGQGGKPNLPGPTPGRAIP